MRGWLTKSLDKQLRTLADGKQIPLLGLGVWQIPNGATTVNSVRWALELGYRHIDTAQAYGNEESVGRALKESGVPRNEVFITTKFWPGAQDPVVEAERSLRRLGVDFVDLYLIHWPQGGPTRAWGGMERAHEKGYARSIGVSNYDVRELDQVMAMATVAQVVRAAKPDRDPQIDAPQSDRRKLARLRLHALSRRYGGARCARRHGRNGSRPRRQVVVNP